MTIASPTTLESPVKVREPVTFELDQPVEGLGERLTELTIKPFTGKDLIECGVPFTMKRDRDGNISELVDPRACCLLISRMAVVQPTLIEKLAVVDFMTAIELMKVFFTTEARKRPRAIPRSRTLGRRPRVRFRPHPRGLNPYQQVGAADREKQPEMRDAASNWQT